MENKEGISFQVSNLRQAGVTFSIITASASEPLFEIGFCQKKISALSSHQPLLILDDDECRSARSSQRLVRFTLNHFKHRGNQSLLQHCQIRLDYATQYFDYNNDDDVDNFKKLLGVNKWASVGHK